MRALTAGRLDRIGTMPEAPNEHLGHDGAAYPDSYYVRLSEDRLVSTLHSQGAWQPGEQHLAPASGMVLAEIERRLPSDKLISRVTFDVLGVIHSGEFTIDVNVVRPGRTIELVEAHMRHGERTSVTARVWRLQASDTEAVAGDEWSPMPPVSKMPEVPFTGRWGGGFIAVEVAVAQTRLLAHGARVLGMVGDLERQDRCFGEHLDGGVDDLDLAGGQVRVGVAIGAHRDGAGGLDDGFVAQLVGIVLTDDDLHDSRSVAQIDEGHTSVIATTIDPPGEGDGFSCVRGSQASGFVASQHLGLLRDVVV